MHLLLHIGTEKTGTTSLQRFFSKNRSALYLKNIWYPASLGQENHIKLAVAARDAANPDNHFMPLGIQTVEDHAKFATQAKEKFRAEFADAAARGCETCMVSSEHLHSRLTSLAMVDRVKAFFDDLFETTTIFVHLRPQVDLAVSLASTACRMGHRVTEKWFEGQLQSDNPYYNYDELVARWERGFGEKNVRIVSYFRTPSTIDYFRNMLGLEGGDDEERINENIALGVKTIALANNIKLRNKRILEFLERLPPSDPLSLGYEIAAGFQRLFDASNAALCARRNDIAMDDLGLNEARYQRPSNLAALRHPAFFRDQLNALIEQYERL